MRVGEGCWRDWRWERVRVGKRCWGEGEGTEGMLRGRKRGKIKGVDCGGMLGRERRGEDEGKEVMLETERVGWER